MSAAVMTTGQVEFASIRWVPWVVKALKFMPGEVFFVDRRASSGGRVLAILDEARVLTLLPGEYEVLLSCPE